MYNQENYRRIKREFEQKHFAAAEAAEQRMREVEEKIPVLVEIHRTLRSTGCSIFAASLSENREEEMARLKRENQELREVARDLLLQNGYPADYTQVRYECPLCDDTGFTKESKGRSICGCMKRALILAGYESSGIGAMLDKQTFDSFSLSYYPEEDREKNMRKVFERSQQYAETFHGEGSGNLLFFGATGLGKTHLSTAIAKAVIDRGYDVVYDTAQNIFSVFEAERFGKDREGSVSEPAARYFDCDLLILDDLGAEMSTQFTVSCLYQLLNERMMTRRPMIISTNLQFAEIRQRYTDRICSRLLGEFFAFQFTGKDIRMQKLRS
ncbi:MAG: ATP-binding protein [Clostridia bacterium]|nr:ATP-binding protein [Clostridia bacterium]MBO4798826.1 ATP-binding protein [Candidatus Methanomethylophilaceae archaeon]